MWVTFCAKLFNLASGTVLYLAKEINAKTDSGQNRDSRLEYELYACKSNIIFI